MDNQLLVSNIKKFCSYKKISIMELEDRIEVSHGLISRWGKSNGNPSLDKIIEVSKVLDVPIAELIGVDNKSSKLVLQDDRENVIKSVDEYFYNSDLKLINKLKSLDWKVYRYDYKLISQFDDIVNNFEFEDYEPYYVQYKNSYFLLIAGYFNMKPILKLYLLPTIHLPAKNTKILSENLIELWKNIRENKKLLAEVSDMKSDTILMELNNE